MLPWMIQGIGLVGTALFVWAFQMKKRGYILIITTVGVFVYVVHFTLLGAWTAIGMGVVAIIRNFFFYKGKKPIYVYTFASAFVIAGIITWRDLHSVLPIAGMVIETVGYWVRQEKLIRRINIIPRPLWIWYNWHVGSYAGVINDIVLLSSILVAIWRYDIHKVQTCAGKSAQKNSNTRKEQS